MDKIRDQYLSEGFLTKLLLLWFITIPFGSKIVALSLGAFTVYPNLLLTGLLFPLVLLRFKSWGLFQKLFMGLLALWLARSALFVVSNGLTSDAIFDIRSILLYMSFAGIIFSASTIGSDGMKSVMIRGIKIILGIILAFGIFEFVTGHHFVGHYTEQLLHQSINNNFFAPTFVFDNSNDYLVYAFLLFVIWTQLDEELKRNFWKKMAILFVLLVFAFYASARGFILLASLWVIGEFVGQLITHRKKLLTLRNIGWFGLIAALSGLLLVRNDIQKGPAYDWKNGQYVLNGIHVMVDNDTNFRLIRALDTVPDARRQQLLDAFYARDYSGPTSNDLRKNLVLNGVDMIKSNLLLGVGPGQYRARSRSGEVPNDVGSLNSPHNYFIEVSSQYGLAGIFYFLFIFGLGLRVLFLKINWLQKLGLGCVFAVYFLTSMIPSSFLYLDVNWLFLPLLLAYTPLGGQKNERFANGK